MLIREAIAFGKQRLSGLENASELEAEWLLEWVLDTSRAMLLIQGERALDVDQQGQFEAALNRRLAGEPLQYIIGTQEFMGLEFEVDPSVLIPRGDTECLVELILEHYKGKTEALRAADLGSGSGAIGVSLTYYLKQMTMTCVDFSAGAIEMTRRNAERLLNEEALQRFQAVHGDMFDYLAGEKEASFDLIVSNPPYIPSAVIEDLQTEVRLHEPRTALDGGADGLDYYRRLIKEAGKKLKPGAWMLFEVGHDQAEAVSELFLDDGGYQDIQCYRDLQGIWRIAGAHKK